jgi:hypothetical protein
MIPRFTSRIGREPKVNFREIVALLGSQIKRQNRCVRIVAVITISLKPLRRHELSVKPSLGPTLCSPFQFPQDGQWRHTVTAPECGLYLTKQIMAISHEIVKQHCD